MGGHDGGHSHGGVHPGEADWEAMIGDLEAGGELMIGFVTDAISWARELRGPDASAVRRVLDIGSGPGVGTCQLARLFPDAHVVAVDGSAAILERARLRAAAEGLDGRISTHLAELPHGLDDLEAADLIWASMSLHHVGDETAALRALRDLLAPSGLLALAERAGPMQVLPANLDIGQPGLGDRLDRAETEGFAAMREALPGSVASTDLSSMMDAAGFEVLGTRLARQRFEAPLSDVARRVALGNLSRLRARLEERLDEEDRRALDVLIDPDDPRGVMHRPDVFVASSRQIVIARPLPDR